MPHRVLVGQASVHEVWPLSSDPLLNKVLDSWQLQSSFALAVLLDSRRCAAAAATARAGGGSSSRSSRCGFSTAAGAGAAAAAQSEGAGGPPCCALHAPVAAALLLCWADKEVVLLHLPHHCSEHAAAAAAAAGDADRAAAQWVWDVVRGVLGDSSRTVTCIGAAGAVAALAAAGIECRAALDDPAAAFQLWQPRGLESSAGDAASEQQQQPGGGDREGGAAAGTGAAPSAAEVSRAAAVLVLGDSYRLQVPLLPNAHGTAAATAAAKAALLGRALMPPLRAVLAKQCLTAAYEGTERPLLAALADVRASGLCVRVAALRQAAAACAWQRAMLRQQVAQVAAAQQGMQGLGDPGDDGQVRLLLSQQRLLSFGQERMQQQPLQVLLLAALRAALRTQQWGQLRLLRLLLSYWQLQSFEAALSGLMLHAARHGSVARQQLQQQQCCEGERVLLQPLPCSVELTGELLPGWPVSLAPLLTPIPVASLPVAVYNASLAQQGLSALAAPAAVAAAVPAAQHPDQQQQQGSCYFVGVLCGLARLPASSDPGLCDSQQMPWQQQESRGGEASHQQLQLQQQQAGSTSGGLGDSSTCFGTVRRWCGVSGCVQELRLLTTAVHSAQQQESCDGSDSSSSLAFLPGSLSMQHLLQPAADTDAASSNCSFIGVRLQCLPLLVAAAVSREPALLTALQQPDPWDAAAAAWLPRSGLPPALVSQVLACIAAGVLDGCPVAPAAARRLLFVTALRALLLGQRPAQQRECLGLSEWPRGCGSLADSVCDAFEGLASWKAGMLEKTRQTGSLHTCLGRKLPFRLPPAAAPGGPQLSKAAAKQLKEAERSAASLVLLANAGDVERLVVAALQRCATAWHQQHQAAVAAAAAAAAAAAGDSDAGGGGAVAQQQAGISAGSGKPRHNKAAAAAVAAGRADPPSSPQQQRQWRFVSVGGQHAVLQVPSGWALPLLGAAVRQVETDVCQALGLPQDLPPGVAPGGEAPPAAGARLPFRWWWGGSMDVCRAQHYAPV